MQKEIDEFSAAHSVTVDWCQGCLCHTVYCPECQANECGGCHAEECGSKKFSERMQNKLNELVENWGKEK